MEPAQETIAGDGDGEQDGDILWDEIKPNTHPIETSEMPNN